MSNPTRPDDKLADTGRPDDPAKRENHDTRESQQQPYHQPDDPPSPDDTDPALETTRKAGQGAG